MFHYFGFSSFVNTKGSLSFGFKYAAVLTEFLKIAAKSAFGRNIPWKMIDFFRRDNGFKKCILSQIGLIRH